MNAPAYYERGCSVGSAASSASLHGQAHHTTVYDSWSTTQRRNILKDWKNAKEIDGVR